MSLFGRSSKKKSSHHKKRRSHRDPASHRDPMAAAHAALRDAESAIRDAKKIVSVHAYKRRKPKKHGARKHHAKKASHHGRKR